MVEEVEALPRVHPGEVNDVVFRRKLLGAVPHVGVGINILAAGQQGICRRMATAVEDRFRGFTWQPSLGGAPVLDGVVAWIEGSVEAEHEAGDHVIVVVRVHHLHGGADGQPLVFHRGRYGGFAA